MYAGGLEPLASALSPQEFQLHQPFMTREVMKPKPEGVGSSMVSPSQLWSS